MTDTARAEQSISERFSRMMRATTSPFGMLTDPIVIALPTAIGLVALLAVMQSGAPIAAVRAVQALVALPIVSACVVTAVLFGARRRVVDWLAGLPFPVENMNAVLNGLGESIEVTFESSCPTNQELNPLLDAVHTDCFVLDVSPETRVVEIRIGVVDSKRNPAATNHARYVRVQRIVERALVPLHATHPIVEARVK
jgi:hypothetical protein